MVDLEKLKAWSSVARDVIAYGSAGFMLIYGTTNVHNPTVLTIIIGGGLALLGVPAAFRLNDWLRRNGNGNNGNGAAVGKEDRWSHLP